MAYYELIYIIRPDLSNEQVEQVKTRVEERLKSDGGQVLRTEIWGRRTLAYVIKKTQAGIYIFQVLEGSGKMVANLEKMMVIDEDILKFQTIRTQEATTEPTPLAPAEKESDQGEKKR
ncbi:30S ribosomal protein S6 [Magnetococcales bacterium HHB-1]